MKRWIIPAAIAVATVGYLAIREDKPADFNAQFITLPSGRQAYCNRQGYREIRVQTGRLRTEAVLVTDPDGEFVACDARVAPPGDDIRADAGGNLLNDAQISERRQQTVQASSELDNLEVFRSYAAYIEQNRDSCPDRARREDQFVAEHSDAVQAVRWYQRRNEFQADCVTTTNAM